MQLRASAYLVTLISFIFPVQVVAASIAPTTVGWKNRDSEIINGVIYGIR